MGVRAAQLDNTSNGQRARQAMLDFVGLVLVYSTSQLILLENRAWYTDGFCSTGANTITTTSPPHCQRRPNAREIEEGVFSVSISTKSRAQCIPNVKRRGILRNESILVLSVETRVQVSTTTASAPQGRLDSQATDESWACTFDHYDNDNDLDGVPYRYTVVIHSRGYRREQYSPQRCWRLD